MEKTDILKLVNKGHVTACGLMDSEKIAKMSAEQFNRLYITQSGVEFKASTEEPDEPGEPETPATLTISMPETIQSDTATDFTVTINPGSHINENLTLVAHPVPALASIVYSVPAAGGTQNVPLEGSEATLSLGQFSTQNTISIGLTVTATAETNLNQLFTLKDSEGTTLATATVDSTLVPAAVEETTEETSDAPTVDPE